MKVTALAIFALLGALGVVLGMGYGGGGGGGGYTYMPAYGGQGGGMGYGDNTFMYVIGLMFLCLVLFQSGLFNFTSSSSTSTTTPISIVQG